MVWNDLEWYGMTWNGLELSLMGWSDLEWHGMHLDGAK